MYNAELIAKFEEIANRDWQYIWANKHETFLMKIKKFIKKMFKQ